MSSSMSSFRLVFILDPALPCFTSFMDDALECAAQVVLPLSKMSSCCTLHCQLISSQSFVLQILRNQGHPETFSSGVL